MSGGQKYTFLQGSGSTLWVFFEFFGSPSTLGRQSLAHFRTLFSSPEIHREPRIHGKDTSSTISKFEMLFVVAPERFSLGEAFLMGRTRKVKVREDWEQVKDSIMEKAVLKKFSTHADIKEILLATGDEEIVENSPIDYYWGCGADGSGKNRLGQILMQVRETLRNQSEN